MVTPVLGGAPAQGVQCIDTLAFLWGGSQRVEIPVVRTHLMSTCHPNRVYRTDQRRPELGNSNHL
jgi:hypothetical protein